MFLFLNTDDFWRDFRAYQAKGVEFVREPSEQPYGTVAVFKDLYGNLWDLIQLRDAPVKFSLHPIGYVQSSIRALDEAPRQGSEGAPDAWLDVNPTFARGLFGLSVGEKIIVITWLQVADRNILEVHPRGNPAIPLAGVFTTRSAHRPNPLGLHRVTVREISGPRLRIGPIEVIDGTPVLDIKPVLVDCADG